MRRNLIRRRAAPLSLGTLLAILAGAAGAAPPGISPLQRASLQKSAQIEVFVQLDTPSVAETNISSLQATGALASRDVQQQQAARIDAQQRDFRQYLGSLGATELGALRVGANGLRVRIGADQLEALKSLPGVRTVAHVRPQRLHNITSVPWIGAPILWNTLKAKGEHIKIGIIDTGIDYTHANFGGPGTPEAYAAIDPNKADPKTFPTAKVKGGIDFAGPTYDASDPTSVPQPDDNPLDVEGHGSHIAGTAAGFGVTGKIGPGVAPAADLYAIKVFGDKGGSTNLTSQGIEWALDPNGDGDMSDHLDVINMSLGTSFSEPNDPSAIASEHAADLGIVVVASAGNDAAVPYVTGAPADAPGAISVAASIPGGRVWSRVNVTAPAGLSGFKDNLEGAGPVQLKDLTAPLSAVVVDSDPTNGCTLPPTAPATAVPPAFANASAVAGKIALVERGTCSFIAKYQAAAVSGAVAIIVYNDGADPTRVDPLVMAADGTTIPGVMIRSTDGIPLAAAATTTAPIPVNVTLDTAPNPAKDDQIASFSSRGPGSGGTHFKPEISDPGYAIVSTAVGTGTDGVSFRDRLHDCGRQGR
jgi:minor extracellular serine protease Vpr